MCPAILTVDSKMQKSSHFLCHHHQTTYCVVLDVCFLFVWLWTQMDPNWTLPISAKLPCISFARHWCPTRWRHKKMGILDFGKAFFFGTIFFHRLVKQHILRKPCAGTVRVQGFAKIVQNGLTQAAGSGRLPWALKGCGFGEKTTRRLGGLQMGKKFIQLTWIFMLIFVWEGGWKGEYLCHLVIPGEPPFLVHPFRHKNAINSKELRSRQRKPSCDSSCSKGCSLVIASGLSVEWPMFFGEKHLRFSSREKVQKHG